MLLLSHFATDALAIHPGYARTTLPILAEAIKNGSPLNNIFGNKLPETPEAKIIEHMVIGFAGESFMTVNMANSWAVSQIRDASVGIINVRGPISKGDACVYGTNDWTQMVASINSNPKIVAGVVKADSPGGFVSGIQTFADAVAKSKKPIIGFIDDGMAASCGYWAICNAKEVYSSHATSQVGSIGVFVQLADVRKFYENQGIEIIEIYSDYSSEKNDVFIKALDGDTKPMKEELLNPLAKAFISQVKAGRKGKLNLSEGDPFKGKLYLSEEAKAIGLIDGIMSFEQVVARAYNLGTSISIS